MKKCGVYKNKMVDSDVSVANHFFMQKSRFVFYFKKLFVT